MKLRELWRWPTVLVAVLGLLVMSEGQARVTDVQADERVPAGALQAVAAEIEAELGAAVPEPRHGEREVAARIETKVFRVLSEDPRDLAQDPVAVRLVANWLVGAEELRSPDKVERNRGMRRIAAACARAVGP